VWHDNVPRDKNDHALGAAGGRRSNDAKIRHWLAPVARGVGVAGGGFDGDDWEIWTKHGAGLADGGFQHGEGVCGEDVVEVVFGVDWDGVWSGIGSGIGSGRARSSGIRWMRDGARHEIAKDALQDVGAELGPRGDVGGRHGREARADRDDAAAVAAEVVAVQGPVLPWTGRNGAAWAAVGGLVGGLVGVPGGHGCFDDDDDYDDVKRIMRGGWQCAMKVGGIKVVIVQKQKGGTCSTCERIKYGVISKWIIE
jgi:hypothetical protein